MNIFDYIKGFAANFNRSRVSEDIQVTRDELVNHTLDPLELFVKTTMGKPFKSETYALYAAELERNVNTRLRGGNAFTLVQAALQNAVEILSFIDTTTSKEFAENVTSSSLTVSRANLLQLLDTVNFTSRYTRRLMDAVLVAETNAGVEGKGELDTLTAGDLKYLSQNRSAYVAALNTLLTPVAKVKDMFDDMPEINLAEVKSKSALSTHGNKIDPMRFGIVESRFNPIWLMVVGMAEYHATRYKTAREEKEVLELRIQRLKRQYDNDPNPRLGNIIEKREGQLDVLRAKLSKMENA